MSKFEVGEVVGCEGQGERRGEYTCCCNRIEEDEGWLARSAERRRDAYVAVIREVQQDVKSPP